MRYGCPYKGSKNAIAKQIVDALPPAEHFYDLFAGGCAITHAAMLSGKYKFFHINDLSDAPLLFARAIRGQYNTEKRWICREEFFEKKHTDPYIGLCWSFSNNREDYLYSKQLEPYKKAVHYAVVLNDPSLFYSLTGIPLCINPADHSLNELENVKIRYSLFRRFVRENETALREFFHGHRYQYVHSNKSLRSLQSLESLERLQSLESLQSLERLQKFLVTQLDYRNVPIEPNSVIYCDPPYKGTTGYNTEFNHEEFYDWAEQQNNIFISEYEMP